MLSTDTPKLAIAHIFLLETGKQPAMRKLESDTSVLRCGAYQLLLFSGALSQRSMTWKHAGHCHLLAAGSLRPGHADPTCMRNLESRPPSTARHIIHPSATHPKYTLKHCFVQALRTSMATCQQLARCGLLALALRSLAAADTPLRALAYDTLALATTALESEDFRCAACGLERSRMPQRVPVTMRLGSLRLAQSVPNPLELCLN